eukprot:NODE_399_length_8099_cov_0.731375.p3 type:complete len:271 gc:universal NODE_399_length_8099_cov_0.731375:6586-5774(-)
MNADVIAPNVFEKITKNCCNSDYATCNTAGQVTGISFRFIDFSSAGYHLNGTFGKMGLPPALVTLRIKSDHTIFGKFPPIPVNMTEITIDNCFLSGDMPIFPPTLTILSLQRLDWAIPNTFLTGSLNLFKPTTLLIANNQISSVSINDTTQLTLAKCDLSSNALLNDTNVPNLTMCKKFYLVPAPPAALQIETTLTTTIQSTLASTIATTSIPPVTSFSAFLATIESTAVKMTLKSSSTSPSTLQVTPFDSILSELESDTTDKPSNSSLI